MRLTSMIKRVISIVSVLFYFLVFSNLADLYALENEPRPIFVFVSVDSTHPNSTTINLYQDIQSEIRTSYTDKFYLMPTDEGLKHIKATSIDMLNSVLYVDKSEFIASKEKKEPISTLQYIMETYAVDDIFVVDCMSNSDGSVSSCGIYVYNRVKRGFNVAVEKKFSAPIYDTSSWGSILVERLITNIENLKLDKTQEKLDRLLNDTNEETIRTLTTQVSAGVNFLNINVKRLYGGSLSILSFANTTTVDSMEKSSNSQEDRNDFGLYAGVEAGYYYGKSSAHDDYCWSFESNLFIGNKFIFPYIDISLEGIAGYSVIKAGQDQNGSDSIGFVQKSVQLGGGIKFQKTFSNFSVGLEPRYSKYIKLKHNYSFINKKINHAGSVHLIFSWDL